MSRAIPEAGSVSPGGVTFATAATSGDCASLLAWLREAPPPLRLESVLDLRPGGPFRGWLAAEGPDALDLHIVAGRAGLALDPLVAPPPERPAAVRFGIDFGHPVVHQEFLGPIPYPSILVEWLERLAAGGLGSRLRFCAWALGPRPESLPTGVCRDGLGCVERELAELRARDLAETLPFTLELALDRLPNRVERVALQTALSLAFHDEARFSEEIRPAMLGGALLERMVELGCVCDELEH